MAYRLCLKPFQIFIGSSQQFLFAKNKKGSEIMKNLTYKIHDNRELYYPAFWVQNIAEQMNMIPCCHCHYTIKRV